MGLLQKIGNFISSRKFLINVILIGIVYVAGYFLLSMYLTQSTNHGQQVEVPNLIGENQNNLENLMALSGLSYQVLDSIYEPSKVEGTILEQDPAPSKLSGVYVKDGRTVKVRVSKRTQLVEVPNLVDKSQRFAEGILNNREFRYKLEYKPSKEAHGAVIEQLYKGRSIHEGAKLPIGSKITLIVGRDEAGEAVQIPNLFGLTILEAQERVRGIGAVEFFTVCPTCLTSADSLNARIESQSPEFSEGAMVAAGTTISVFATTEFNEQ
ncbi:MAG: PASTA domain-containing protein [Crocinitomicaceae bacterium]|nr:PASTA domain-containing protein [Crocinitomicaceae bacterium]